MLQQRPRPGLEPEAVVPPGVLRVHDGAERGAGRGRRAWISAPRPSAASSSAASSTSCAPSPGATTSPRTSKTSATTSSPRRTVRGDVRHGPALVRSRVQGGARVEARDHHVRRRFPGVGALLRLGGAHALPLSGGLRGARQRARPRARRRGVRLRRRLWHEGCYTYSSGTYAGKAYFGTGGERDDMEDPVADPKDRVLCVASETTVDTNAVVIQADGTIAEEFDDGYPGTSGCEVHCEGSGFSESECGAEPYCGWDEGRCWSLVGPDPCPVDTNTTLTGESSMGDAFILSDTMHHVWSNDYWGEYYGLGGVPGLGVGAQQPRRVPGHVRVRALVRGLRQDGGVLQLDGLLLVGRRAVLVRGGRRLVPRARRGHLLHGHGAPRVVQRVVGHVVVRGLQLGRLRPRLRPRRRVPGHIGLRDDV